MHSQDYKHLKVWQKSIDLSLQIYKVTDAFPEREKFGLTSQMRRAAISIASNIAEGNKRSSNKEFRQFLRISLGSGAELETQRIIANGLGLLDEAAGKQISESIDEIMRMLSGLEKAIGAKMC